MNLACSLLFMFMSWQNLAFSFFFFFWHCYVFIQYLTDIQAPKHSFYLVCLWWGTSFVKHLVIFWWIDCIFGYLWQRLPLFACGLWRLWWGRTNSRVRWVGRDPWRSGVWLCSKAQDAGTAGCETGRSIGQAPLAHGKWGIGVTRNVPAGVFQSMIAQTLHKPHGDHPQE